MREGYIKFLQSVAHRPEHKRKQSEELHELYQAYLAQGKVPFVITRETLKAQGPRKLSKNVSIGNNHVGSYVKGERQPPTKFFTEEERARLKSERIKEKLRLRKEQGLPIGAQHQFGKKETA